MENPLGLTCPKCRGAMSSYERAGVVIDQCQECRGIFLDRGELERLLDVSTGHQPVAPSSPDERQWRQQPPQQREWKQSRNDWDDDSDSHRRGSGHSGHGKPKKKHSMLREFLDFG